MLSAPDSIACRIVFLLIQIIYSLIYQIQAFSMIIRRMIPQEMRQRRQTPNRQIDRSSQTPREGGPGCIPALSTRKACIDYDSNKTNRYLARSYESIRSSTPDPAWLYPGPVGSINFPLFLHPRFHNENDTIPQYDSWCFRNMTDPTTMSQSVFMFRRDAGKTIPHK